MKIVRTINLSNIISSLLTLSYLLGLSSTSKMVGSNNSELQPSELSQQEMSFFTKLENRIAQIDSHLCIGLDPHIKELFPNGDHDSKTEEERCDAAFTFCKTLIDLTAPYAAAYKPNAAFFEALGTNLGITTLRRVISEIPSEIPILLDVKRGDIGTTAEAYATACYDPTHGLKADSVTLSPLMGWDSIRPFITGKYRTKGVFILCKTSNPGSNDLLALEMKSSSTISTLYERIASLSTEWSNQAISEDQNQDHHESPRIGLVVGSTDPTALRKARAAAGNDVWILAPGVGAQGGDLLEACLAGMNHQGTKMLIPVSRGISKAANPRDEAEKLKNAINNARQTVIQTFASTICSENDSDNNQNQVMVAPYQREFLEFSLKEGVLKFGSFVLKSGRTSPYFFNAGLFSSGAALFKLGKAYAAAIMSSDILTSSDGKVQFDIVFGPAYKGISLGAIVCAALYDGYGVDVGFAYDRKEVKDHGEGGKLVGATMAHKRVLIIDDVITAGTAIRESHSLLVSIGAIPVGVCIALDRAEKRSLDDPVSAVQAVARDLKIPVVSIVSLPQLQGFLNNHPSYEPELIQRVSQYRKEFGV